MTARCPSDLALEAHLLDPARSTISTHVAGCDRCAARLEQMRAEGEDFALHVLPATIGAIEEAAARRPWWRRPLFVVPVPVAAALAALLLVVRPYGPPDDYVGAKGGGALGLTLFTPGPAGVVAIPDRGPVSAGAAIRFRVRTASDCNLWIASVDSTGIVSRLYPPAGDRGAPTLAGEQELPGGAILDGRLGSERVYAVCTRHALPWEELEATVRGATARPASVREPSSLTRLPDGAAWYSILLEKRP